MSKTPAKYFAAPNTFGMMSDPNRTLMQAQAPAQVQLQNAMQPLISTSIPAYMSPNSVPYSGTSTGSGFRRTGENGREMYTGDGENPWTMGNPMNRRTNRYDY